jgi:hypothetical protein
MTPELRGAASRPGSMDFDAVEALTKEHRGAARRDAVRCLKYGLRISW